AHPGNTGSLCVLPLRPAPRHQLRLMPKITTVEHVPLSRLTALPNPRHRASPIPHAPIRDHRIWFTQLVINRLLHSLLLHACTRYSSPHPDAAPKPHTPQTTPDMNRIGTGHEPAYSW